MTNGDSRVRSALGPTLLLFLATFPAAAQVAPPPLILYEDALQNGFELNSWGTAADPSHTGTVYAGTHSLQKNLPINGGSGDFMAIHRPAGFNTADYTHIDFYARSLSPEGALVRVRFATAAWAGTDEEVPISIPSGSWIRFVIPFTDFGSSVLDQQFAGIAFSGGGPGAPFNDDDNNVAFDNVRLVQLPDTTAPQLVSAEPVGLNVVRLTFSETLDAASAGTIAHYAISSSQGMHPLSSATLLPNGSRVDLALATDFVDGRSYTVSVSGVSDGSGNVISAGSTASFTATLRSATLSVDAAQDVYPFSSKMRGVATSNWSWIWAGIADPSAPKRQALIELARYIKPGVIRFAGGLWANGVGWDRTNIAPDDGNWTTTDPATGQPYNYRHAYKPAMIDSYAAFAAAVGAETILQCNISDNNPAMWADMVRYCNVEHAYNFKYWELGNELELVPGEENVRANLGVSYAEGPREYGNRFAAYRPAMRQIDPTIKIMGPVVHAPYRAQDWFKPVFDRVAELGQSVDALSWHTYQLTEWSSDPASGWPYNGGSVEALFALNEVVGTTTIGVSGMGNVDPGQSVPPDLDVGLNTYRRQCAEATLGFIKNVVRPSHPTFETAITEFGTHAVLHEHPINANHIAAVWLADMLARYAYNGLDMITYYTLEDGTTGRGNSRGLVGVEAPRFIDVRPIYYTEFLYAQFFGDRLVRSSTSDLSQKVVVWASADTAEPGSLKLMLVNLTGDVAVAGIEIAGFSPAVGYAYEMTSTNPLSMDNPRSFSEHETTINGFVIPDYDAENPASWRGAVASIASKSVSVSTSFTYSLPPYSAVAMVLKDSAAAPPPSIGPNPPLPPMPPGGNGGGSSGGGTTGASSQGGRCGLLGLETFLLLTLLVWNRNFRR
ncbi:MAG: Ig-like domain-containing protein [Planctomycetes bacterium]|nr:Ig-like domain-containing protein [Planctomycetota bacterium]